MVTKKETGKQDPNAMDFGEDMDETPKKGKKKSSASDEYPKSIRKMISVSGTARIMKCHDRNKCGGFDDIINIYTDDGRNGIVAEYKNSPTLNLKGHKDIDKANVVRKDLTFWGGNPREHTAEYRHKKHSHTKSRRKK